MTTADAIKILTCRLAINALKAAEQHDYMISCKADWCYDATELYALELVVNNPQCDQSLLDRIEINGETPDLPEPDETQDCLVMIRDVTPQLSCDPISIREND